MALAASISHWGSTPAERLRPYGCDQLIENPQLTLFRAIDVEASPPIVFRWLCQLRTAPYSYDKLDNFGRRSPQRLTPGLERLAVGQRVMTIFRLVGFEPGRSLTIRSSSPIFGEVAGTYAVEARPGRCSRIVVKLTWRHGGPKRLEPVLARLLGAGDLLMMRRQLLNLKRLAERTAAAGPDPDGALAAA